MNLKDLIIAYDLDVLISIVSFSVFATIFVLQKVAEIKYFRLYRKKINPDFPLFWYEEFSYFTAYKDRYIKLFKADLYYWKIIFEKHKDKELNDAAKKTRYLLAVTIILFIVNCFIYYLLSWLT